MDAAPLLITTRTRPLSSESRLFSIPLQMLSAHTQTLPGDGRSESSVTSRTSKESEELRFYQCRSVEILNLSPGSGYGFRSVILIKVFQWFILIFTLLEKHMVAIFRTKGKIWDPGWSKSGHELLRWGKWFVAKCETCVKACVTLWWGLGLNRGGGFGVSFTGSPAGVFLSRMLARSLSVCRSPRSLSCCPRSGPCGLSLWQMDTRQKTSSACAAMESLIHYVSNVLILLIDFEAWYTFRLRTCDECVCLLICTLELGLAIERCQISKVGTECLVRFLGFLTNSLKL